MIVQLGRASQSRLWVSFRLLHTYLAALLAFQSLTRLHLYTHSPQAAAYVPTHLSIRQGKQQLQAEGQLADLEPAPLSNI